MPGTLYIVATPLGNLEDISLRAIKVLKNVALIAAEDTRHSRKLLQHLGVTTSLLPYHEHNEHRQTLRLLQLLEEGKDIAVITDAGTPLISDPGYHLVAAAHLKGIRVSPVPGACAAIAALSTAGLPGSHFVFEGFLPSKSTQRRKRLQELAEDSRTIIYYEAPHRIIETLTDMVIIFGPHREAVFARELTKMFETIRYGALDELQNWVSVDKQQQRGEIVLVVAGNTSEKKSEMTHAISPEIILKTLLVDLPVKQAANITAKLTGINKRELYQHALSIKKDLNQSD